MFLWATETCEEKQQARNRWWLLANSQRGAEVLSPIGFKNLTLVNSHVIRAIVTELGGGYSQLSLTMMTELCCYGLNICIPTPQIYMFKP